MALPWGKKDNTSIKLIEDKLQSIWQYTETEISDLPSLQLKEHISSISEIVNDTLFDLSRLKEQECSVCSNKICTPCLLDMEKEFAPSNEKQ